MFELYGVLHKWFINKARKCLEDGKSEALWWFWVSKAEKCINKREDILERLFT